MRACKKGRQISGVDHYTLITRPELSCTVDFVGVAVVVAVAVKFE